jgi:hypothetical protein
MQPILILRNEKINSQVLVKTRRHDDGTWHFTLNNTTKNTYKVFIESCCNDSAGKLLAKKISSEFKLCPGIVTVSEKEIGPVISDCISENNSISLQYIISVCIRQKFGPDLGFHHIEI